MHSNFNDLKTKTMTAEQIAKKYVHGMHNALTDNQEIKDMITDIETYAKEYHEAKLKLLGIGVSGIFIVNNSGIPMSYHKSKNGAEKAVEEWHNSGIKAAKKVSYDKIELSE